MIKMKRILAKQVTPEEQSLKNILSANIRKYRLRRNWSQFALAAKADISTNFLADIEAGNTWISAQTLMKLAKVLEIDAFELLRPENAAEDSQNIQEIANNKGILSQFSQDLSVVLQESVEKALDHVKKQYEIG